MPTSFRFPKMIETVIAAGQAGLQGLNPKSLRETLKDREKMVSSFSKDGGKTDGESLSGPDAELRRKRERKDRRRQREEDAII